MQKDDGRVVSNFINQALTNKPLTIYGDGKQTRSFCYVDDMVAGIKKAMFSDNTKGEVINLGNPDEKNNIGLSRDSLKELQIHPRKLLLRHCRKMIQKSRKPDISKAKKLLDWEPKINIEEGLRKNNRIF